MLCLCSSESAALNMPANVQNSAAATGLEKVSFSCNKDDDLYRDIVSEGNQIRGLLQYSR